MDRNVRAFLAVAPAGNLTVAADRIGLTQPALTKTIRRIEEDYDAVLFERTSRGMNLTPAGERLVPLIDALGDWWENTDENKASDVNEGSEAGGTHSVQHL